MYSLDLLLLRMSLAPLKRSGIEGAFKYGLSIAKTEDRFCPFSPLPLSLAKPGTFLKLAPKAYSLIGPRLVPKTKHQGPALPSSLALLLLPLF